MTWRAADTQLARLAPLLDGIAIVTAGAVGVWLRFSRAALDDKYQLALLLGLLLTLLLLPATRTYRQPRWLHPGHGVLAALPGLAAVFGCLMLIATATKTTADFSRIWMATWLLLSLSLMALWRLLAAKLVARAQARVLLLGAGPLARQTALQLQAQRGQQSVAGFITLTGEATATEMPASVLGGLPQLEALLAAPTADITELWVVADGSAGVLDSTLLTQLQMASLPVRYVPDLRLLQLLGHRASEVAGITVIELNATPLDGPEGLVKAAMDRVLAALLLLLLSPLLALVALLVRLESPGPILFQQPRHGAGGRIIQVLKFRTMVHREQPDERQAGRNDPRVTRAGTLLRRSSIDELPQLVNVLRGDMSLVGPRPHPLALNASYAHQLQAYMQRHRVKPGITGWAQVNGYRGETDTLEKMQCRLEHDLYYIEYWSLWLDLKILTRTALLGWSGRNAY